MLRSCGTAALRYRGAPVGEAGVAGTGEACVATPAPTVKRTPAASAAPRGDAVDAVSGIVGRAL